MANARINAEESNQRQMARLNEREMKMQEEQAILDRDQKSKQQYDHRLNLNRRKEIQQLRDQINMNQEKNKIMKIQDRRDDFDYMSRQIQQNQEI